MATTPIGGEEEVGPLAFSVRGAGRAHRSGLPILESRPFRDVLARECQRSNRFNVAFTLVIVSPREGTPDDGAWRRVTQALLTAKRDIDVLGWLEPCGALGLLVSETGGRDSEYESTIATRIAATLGAHLGAADPAYSVLAHRMDPPGPAMSGTAIVPPADAFHSRASARVSLATKRALDVILSAVLVVLLFPLFALIAVLIKFKSPGPVFFRQERIGEGGKPFTMLKFRTMHLNSDPSIHERFVTQFIRAAKPANGLTITGAPFKILNDPRVTSIGQLLRRSSLDELPQLWNVLRGDMSLVGPRPPLRYEVDHYKHWHYRRLLEAKPGITGLWQVHGRSRTTFDDKVRLDLRYVKQSSLWTDIKILLATPPAVFFGRGAR
jgi:lipopolysaccharide/colanic/teichoic acid biosynthesis glycosyltransferase